MLRIAAGILSCIVTGSLLFAQPYTDAAVVALSGAGVANLRPRSFSVNPAAAATMAASFRFTGCYLYGIPELAAFGTAGVGRVRRFGAGAEVSTFGFSEYREMQAALVVATRPLARVPARLGFTYQAVLMSIPDLERRAFGGPGIGIQYFAGETLSVGASVQHAFRASGEMKAIQAGLAWLTPENVQLLLDVRGSGRRRLAVLAGSEIPLGSVLTLRFGFSSYPESWSTGFGLMMGSFGVDAAVGHHPVLGTTPAVTLGLLW